MDPLEVIDNHPAEVFHMRLLRLTIGQGQIMDKTIKLFTAVRDQQITARSPEYRLLSDEIDDLRKLTQGSTLDLNLRKATATLREAVHAGNPAIQHEETTWMGRVLNDMGAGS